MINKCDIISKINKYKITNKYFFENFKFKLSLLIITWTLCLLYIIFIFFNFKYKNYFFYTSTVSIVCLTSVNYYTNYKKNVIIDKISKELNISRFELKYLIKKFKIDDKF